MTKYNAAELRILLRDCTDALAPEAWEQLAPLVYPVADVYKVRVRRRAFADDFKYWVLSDLYKRRIAQVEMGTRKDPLTIIHDRMEEQETPPEEQQDLFGRMLGAFIKRNLLPDYNRSIGRMHGDEVEIDESKQPIEDPRHNLPSDGEGDGFEPPYSWPFPPTPLGSIASPEYEGPSGDTGSRLRSFMLALSGIDQTTIALRYYWHLNKELPEEAVACVMTAQVEADEDARVIDLRTEDAAADIRSILDEADTNNLECVVWPVVATLLNCTAGALAARHHRLMKRLASRIRLSRIPDSLNYADD